MNELFELISRQIKSARVDLKRFDEEYTKDAAHAFQWGEEAMKAAASERMWADIDRMARLEGASVEGIAAKIQKEALSAARSNTSSTSATQNLMRNFRTVALARAAEELQDIVKYEAKLAA